MDIDGEIVRLDPEAGRVLYDPKDWELVEGQTMIRHKPTSCIFIIECDDEAMQNGEATLFQFSASLIHVCDHRRIPSITKQVTLGRAALAVFLQAIGVWKPEVREVTVRRSCSHGAPRPA